MLDQKVVQLEITTREVEFPAQESLQRHVQKIESSYASDLGRREPLIHSAQFRSRCLKINRLIKSASSAASPMTKMKESARLPVVRAESLSGAPLRFGPIEEAALAADLIRRLVFEHSAQNLATAFWKSGDRMMSAVC